MESPLYGKEEQFNILSNLFGNNFNFLPTIMVWGPASTGKRSMLNSLLSIKSEENPYGLLNFSCPEPIWIDSIGIAVLKNGVYSIQSIYCMILEEVKEAVLNVRKRIQEWKKKKSENIGYSNLMRSMVKEINQNNQNSFNLDLNNDNNGINTEQNKVMKEDIKNEDDDEKINEENESNRNEIFTSNYGYNIDSVFDEASNLTITKGDYKSQEGFFLALRRLLSSLIYIADDDDIQSILNLPPRLYIIFENVDRLPLQKLNILLPLFMIGNITGCNVTTILHCHNYELVLSTDAIDLIQPIFIHFPNYNKNQIEHILSMFIEDLEMNDEEKIYKKVWSKTFLTKYILPAMSSLSTNLSILKLAICDLFPIYISHVKTNSQIQHSDDNFLSIYRSYCNGTDHYHNEDIYQNVYDNDVDISIAEQFSEIQKLILVSSYLAANNSQDSDQNLFLQKTTGRKRKRVTTTAWRQNRGSATSKQITGSDLSNTDLMEITSKSFPLERMLSIFETLYNIYMLLSNDNHNNIELEKTMSYSDLLQEIGTLVELGFIVWTNIKTTSSISSNVRKNSNSAFNHLNNCRLKCSTSEEFVSEIADSIGLDLRDYLISTESSI